MKKLWVYFLFLFLHLSAHARTMMAEDYYITAFNEMSDMLAGRDSLSIKRAVYFAEWAYYEGKLDYKTDFCDEIDRITSFVRLFYDVNKLSSYKTGKQMALNAYFSTHIPETDINLIHTTLKLFQRMISRGIINLCQKF